MKNYLETLKERGRKSKIYSSHQLTGLALSRILDDEKHKSLYMKMAKEYDSQALIRLAKNVAEKRRVINMGAYFMRMLQKEKGKMKKEK